MPHLNQRLRVRYVDALLVGQHLLPASLIYEGDHLLPVLQPALDDLVLRARPDSSDAEDLARRVPLLVHGVEAPEAEPYHASVLVQAHVPPVNDDGAAGPLLGILAPLVELDDLVAVEEGKQLGDLVDSSFLNLYVILGLIDREKFPLPLLGVLHALGGLVHEIWAEY